MTFFFALTIAPSVLFLDPVQGDFRRIESSETGDSMVNLSRKYIGCLKFGVHIGISLTTRD